MRQKRSTSLILLEIGTMLLLLLFFIPFFIVLINASKLNPEIIRNPLSFPDNPFNIFGNAKEIMSRPSIRYFSSFFNSTIITVVSLFAIGTFSAMAAWVLVRTKRRYSLLIFMFFVSGMVVPFQVVMLPLVRLMNSIEITTGIPLIGTRYGIILAYVAFGAPLSVFMFHGFIKSIPIDIEEAAIIDGCTKSQVFFRIILPILKPVFVTMLVLNGMWIWNDYLLPSLVLGIGNDIQTLPLAVAGLAGFYDKDWSLILTAVVMASIPAVILFLFAQKHIIKGMTSGAIK